MPRGYKKDVQKIRRYSLPGQTKFSLFQITNIEFVPAIPHLYVCSMHYKQVTTVMNYNNRCSFSAVFRNCNNGAFDCG